VEALQHGTSQLQARGMKNNYIIDLRIEIRTKLNSAFLWCNQKNFVGFFHGFKTR